MADSITTHTAVPVAAERDARATCDSLESVVDEIAGAAADAGATAIGFRPRSGGRLHRLLSGSDSDRLTTECERPVVVFSRLDSNDA